MTDITGNSGLLEGKVRGSVIITQIVDGINQLIQDELIDSADNLETQSSILTATGIWLDYIGNRLEYPRPYFISDEVSWFGFDGSNGVGFDQKPFFPQGNPDTVPISDESYRSLLIVRGGQLITDCSIPSMDDIIQSAFGSGHYIDNGDMTLLVYLDTSLSDDIIKYVVESGLITKPAGVLLDVILIADIDGTFGFDGSGGVGFDQGSFVRVFSEL